MLKVKACPRGWGKYPTHVLKVRLLGAFCIPLTKSFVQAWIFSSTDCDYTTDMNFCEPLRIRDRDFKQWKQSDMHRICMVTQFKEHSRNQGLSEGGGAGKMGAIAPPPLLGSGFCAPLAERFVQAWIFASKFWTHSITFVNLQTIL